MIVLVQPVATSIVKIFQINSIVLREIFNLFKGEGVMENQKRKIADIVVGKIETEFLKGQIKIGEKLPSERGLASYFGVSRNSVREALQRLALENVIEIKKGGSVVKAQEIHQTYGKLAKKTLASEEHLIFEMLEVRRALEVEAASLAAQRATTEDLQKIAGALQAMNIPIEEVEKGVQADVAFHISIVKASKNTILIDLAETLMKKIKKTIYKTRQHRFIDESRYEETIAEHRAIYMAIASGDHSLAKKYMEAHITNIRRELSEHLIHK